MLASSLVRHHSTLIALHNRRPGSIILIPAPGIDDAYHLLAAFRCDRLCAAASTASYALSSGIHVVYRREETYLHGRNAR